jgi:non-canonical poly(A) RNA polymerase PAPD5/7
LKGKASGFDNDADFIPFELSDDDVERPESRISNLSQDTQPSRRGQPQKERNNDIKKRKRKDIESSPERGPLTQRQKVAEADLNPWQTNWEDYASLKETARMYTLQVSSNYRLHKEVLDFSNWVSPTSKEVQVRAFVAKRVADSIETFYPQCRAYPFGSFSTKLYTPDAYGLYLH